jgi:hypothetical protein
MAVVHIRFQRPATVEEVCVELFLRDLEVRLQRLHI